MRKKLLCLLAVIMISSLACFAACAKGQSGAEAWQVTKRIGIIGNDFEEQNNALENIVTEVTLTYNGKKVTEGYLFFDISKGSFAVSANVKVEGKPEYTVGYTVDDTSVAEVSADGTVTIKGTGEAVLTVTAGDKSHSVVVIIDDENDDTAASHNVTINGGRASLATAKTGSHVTIRPDNATFDSEHREFVAWEYFNKSTGEKVDDLWINGNIFRMPDFDIEINAVTKEKLYTLNVVDATIKTCLVDGAAYEAQAVSQDGINVYSLPYGAEVTLKANAESAENMFVGWDFASRKNRVGEVGADEYTFEMPDEETTVFARFSEMRDIKFQTVSFGTTRTVIENGVVSGESTADEALEGMSGYRAHLAVNSHVTTSTTTTNFRKTEDFSTLKHGSQTIKLLLVNHSDQNLKLEMQAEQYSAVALSGVIEVPANSKVVKKFVISAGFHNPYFGIVMRERASGGTDADILLDVVYATADTYPDGDPMFAVTEAEYVTLLKRSSAADYPANSGIRGDCWECGPIAGKNPGDPQSGSFGGRKNTNNTNGITNFVLRESYNKYNGGHIYLFAEANNLPEYDENDPFVTVYFRLINTGKNTGNFILGLGNSEDVLNDQTRVTYSIDLEAKDVLIFGITYRRSSANDKLIVSIVKPEETGGDYNIILQMMYNNKIGCAAENIAAAE